MRPAGYQPFRINFIQFNETARSFESVMMNGRNQRHVLQGIPRASRDGMNGKRPTMINQIEGMKQTVDKRLFNWLQATNQNSTHNFLNNNQVIIHLNRRDSVAEVLSVASLLKGSLKRKVDKPRNNYLSNIRRGK